MSNNKHQALVDDYGESHYSIWIIIIHELGIPINQESFGEFLMPNDQVSHFRGPADLSLHGVSLVGKLVLCWMNPSCVIP